MFWAENEDNGDKKLKLKLSKLVIWLKIVLVSIKNEDKQTKNKNLRGQRKKCAKMRTSTSLIYVNILVNLFVVNCYLFLWQWEKLSWGYAFEFVGKRCVSKVFLLLKNNFCLILLYSAVKCCNKNENRSQITIKSCKTNNKSIKIECIGTVTKIHWNHNKIEELDRASGKTWKYSKC